MLDLKNSGPDWSLEQNCRIRGSILSVSFSTIVLVAVNLGFLWLLMAAPIGIRTLRVRRTYRAQPGRIWSAIHPLGEAAGWHPSLLASRVDEGGRRVHQSLTHLDRKGFPVERTLEITDNPNGVEMQFASRIVEDSALDQSFWQSYSELRRVEPAEEGARLVIEQTDTYRGVAFLVFRYFAIRREMRALDDWLRTGEADMAGWIEHPLMQVFFAILSTMLLWPFFGLNINGLTLSCQLTAVIVLHEFGHLAAYRAFGHTSARMIFIPLLGGIAIGGRPYNSLFEVATCALMGAGLSAFFVPIVIAVDTASTTGLIAPGLSGAAMTFLLVLGSFNLLNLLPMYRFDGGQVLRQVFPTRDGLMVASFAVTAMLVWVGFRIGLPNQALLAGLSVFVLMSLLGSRGIKPRDALDDMENGERLMTGFGFYAALSIHAYAIIYACDKLFA